MLRLLKKEVRFNPRSFSIGSGIVWLLSLSTFLYIGSSDSEQRSSYLPLVILLSFIIGSVAYLVLIYSLSNLLDIKIKGSKLKLIKYLRLLIITTVVAFLMFGVPIIVLGGIVKLNTIVGNDKKRERQSSFQPDVKSSSTSNYIETTNGDPIINCQNPNCGSIQIRKSLCSNIVGFVCCQVGDTWSWYASRDKCSADQNQYYQAVYNKSKQEEINRQNEAYLEQVRQSVQQRINYYNQIFKPKEEFGAIVNDFKDSANQILEESQNYPTKTFVIPTQDLSGFDSFKNIPTPTSSKIKCSSLQGIAYIEQVDCEP